MSRSPVCDGGIPGVVPERNGSQMVDPARQLHRDLHAAARRDDRERRAAVDRARPQRRLQRPPVGDRRLRADPRELRAGGGVAGRHGRAQGRLHARTRDLHRFLALLRAGCRSTVPQRLARGAGGRRGDDVRHLAGADRAAVPGSRTGTALGIWGATTAAAVSIGPLVGGALVDALSWRSIFLVNVPIGLGALGVARLRLRESRDPGAAGVDLRGVAVLCPALFLLVYALIRGHEEGWGSALIISCFAASALVLVLFVVVELRAAHPLLDLSLFRKPAFTGATIVAFTLAASIFSMFLFITLFFQNVLGFSPFEAGLRSLPVTGPILFVSPLSGRLTARAPVRLLLGTGLAFVAVGVLLMGNLSDSSGWTALLPC